MYPYLKIVFDFFISLMVLILLLPLLILVSILVFISSGMPIFFYQKRIGKNWDEFNLIKFRTMIKNADKMGLNISSSDDKRITKLGKILRKFKLDEIPQFFNVLIGDMSLVGPRPEVYKYASHFSEDYNTILTVKPGISDYASVEFRNEERLLSNKPDKENFYLSEILPKKIMLNKKYIKEMSFVTDLKIIFKTIAAIFR
ncbi:MAG: sugar transferase [Ignavibacteriaceae bacterium]